jgi:hypothetical protein
MVIIKNINNQDDTQKLLSVYIPIIQDYYKNISLSYIEILKHLRLEFNLKVNITDIHIYFDNNIEENQQDLQILTTNLGIHYE